jgi:hypothetical protein
LRKFSLEALKTPSKQDALPFGAPGDRVNADAKPQEALLTRQISE